MPVFSHLRVFSLRTAALMMGTAAALVCGVTAAGAQTSDQAYVEEMPDFENVAHIPLNVLDELLRARETQGITGAVNSILGRNPELLLTEEMSSESYEKIKSGMREGALKTIMRFDTNQDGTLTEEELLEEALLEGKLLKRLGKEPDEKAATDKIIMNAVTYDLNNDGNITPAEISAYQAPEWAYWDRSAAKNLKRLSALDVNGDGVLTRPELTAQFQAAFNAVDLDKDGVLSAPEMYRFRLQYALLDKQQKENNRIKKCAVPKPQTNDRIVFLLAEGMRTYSTVALADSGEVTYAADVDVSRITQPHYLLLRQPDKPVIWNIRGASDKLTHVVVYGPTSHDGAPVRAGIQGVAADKVIFLSAKECFSEIFEIQAMLGGPSQKPAQVLKNVLGRPADVAQTVKDFFRLVLTDTEVVVNKRVPDELPQTAPAGYDQDVWRWTVWAAGNMLQHFKKENILSPVSTEYYSILPNGYGIADLVRMGVLEKAAKLASSQGYNKGEIIGFAFRLKKSLREWPLDAMSTNKLYVPTGITLPASFVNLECKNEKSPKGERVFAFRC